MNDPTVNSTESEQAKPAQSALRPSSQPSQRFTDRSFGIVPVAPPGQTESEPRFLLVQHQAGHWGFPKGHAEVNETALAAARREFEEETGIQDYRLLDETAFSESYHFTKKQKRIEKTVTYYVALVETLQVTVQADELRDYAWLSYSEALKRITFAQSHILLNQVNDYLKSRL